ncbi:MAG: phosphatase PAP2 family protein [Anaeroplasma sp.]
MKISKENKVLLIGLFISIITFIIISIIVYNSGGITVADVAVRDLAYSVRGEKYGFCYWFFRIITEIGNLYFIVFLVIVAALYTKMDNRFFVFGFGLILATLLNMAFKDIFMRERPLLEMRWQNESSYSYPSGHSTNVGFYLPFIMYVFYKSNYKRNVKITSYIVSSILILLIVISRLILGVHYFTDILGGLSSGLAVSFACMLLLKLFNKNNILTKPLILTKKEKVLDEKVVN